ncbi:MAG: hypothetical protein IKF35_05830, partial [Solobacterium sp.]|nr:hypothetical protein [Solobacterium sp.]
VNLFIDTFVVFSNKPIRFVTGCGLFLSLAGLILAIFFIVDWFRNSIVPGWTSLIVVILLTSGFQMVMFGILGEYVWRNLDETRKRPLYVIEKVITAEPEEKHYENRGE